MNTFLVSDTHFSHRGIVQFLRADGVTKERPWDTIEEMDEALVKNWNSVVRPKDRVYHLGDVVINRSALKILGRLNGDKRLIKGNHDCLDELTECLTKRGWMSYQDLSEEDVVFSLNPSTNKGEWKPISDKIVRDHCGPVWELDTERMSMVVTENHRVMFRNTHNGDINYDQPSNIRGLMYLDTSAQHECQEVDISDAYLKVVAWFYTDGCFTKHKGENRAVTFYQSKPAGVERLESVLLETGIDYVKSSEGVTAAGTVVAGKALIKDSLESFVYRVPVADSSELLQRLDPERYTLPDWVYNLSVRQTKLFVEELIAGDGSWGTGKGSQAAVLYGRLRFLEQVQRLCITKGINANLTVFRETDHRLNINFGSSSKVFSISTCTKKGKWFKREYTGKVWCLSTEHTNFMVRRRGQTFFTGNCFRPEEYLEYFKDIRGSHTLDDYILTHIPVHVGCLERWKANIHGHLHSNRVMLPPFDTKGNRAIDPSYFCVSVEQINYAPIAFEEVKRLMEEQNG